MGIDFNLSSEQHEIRNLARRFAENEIRPVAKHLDALQDPRASYLGTANIYRKAAELGFIKAIVPAQYGGLGLGSLDLSLVVEEISRADDSIADNLLVTVLGLKPIMYRGTDKQKAQYLSALAEDDSGDFICAFAASEPDGTANFDCSEPKCGVQTTARRKGTDFVIRGRKAWVTNALGLDGKGPTWFTVLARTEPSSDGPGGPTVFMVPGNAPGISILRTEDKFGCRLCAQAEVDFEDVVIPSTNRVGADGDGLALQLKAFAWLGAVMSAACVGLMEEAFEYVLDFSRNYKAAGPKPILGYPTVGYSMADAKMKIEAARYLVWKACHYNDNHNDDGQEIGSLTKIFCSEAAVAVTTSLMQTMGTHSSSKEHPIEKCVRDSLIFPIRQGSNQGVQRRLFHKVLMRANYDPLGIAYAT